MVKKSINKQQIISLALTVLGFAFGVAALMAVWFVAVRVESDGRLNSDNISKLQSQQAKLEFCYDRQITPCDEVSLKTWNDVNKNDLFNIRATR